jgi:hypothetical protein
VHFLEKAVTPDRDTEWAMRLYNQDNPTRHSRLSFNLRATTTNPTNKGARLTRVQLLRRSRAPSGSDFVCVREALHTSPMAFSPRLQRSVHHPTMLLS